MEGPLIPMMKDITRLALGALLSVVLLTVAAWAFIELAKGTSQ